ncbi:MAG: glycerophosphodiester phosphodiesterase [Clostridiales Family XIII bacterium]|jgi:glycerophosphoryl diester phosphodiesterase|nr:glycerophosphodiester phosphodiesterase [Clostridiales Family XIII bacterium]
MVKNFAHRGYRARYPENTMLAFQKAIEAGCDGIELDVQRSKDGSVVIMHDERVDRTTDGAGFVRDMTLAELRALDAGQGERIPLLDEYFDLVAPLPLITNIEMKNSEIPYDGMEKQVIAMVRERRLDDRIIFSSFKHDSAILCKQTAPGIPCGLLCKIHELLPPNAPKVFARMRDHRIDYIHPDVSSLNFALLEALTQEGIPVNVWTVNAPAVLKRLLAEPCVHGVITDDPALLAGILNGGA